MASKVLEITVNTVTDDNDPKNSLKSLREAIEEANTYANNEKVYINFNLNKSESSQESSNKLNWILKPSTPLPPLTKPARLQKIWDIHSGWQRKISGGVFINHTNPKNVTIDGEILSKSKGRTYSLLTIGEYKSISSTSPYKPSVKIRNINLVNNKISGENGSNGGGGGLAAGAGLSVLHGDVTLNNVVFQNLTATGGNGSKSLGGAQAAYKKWRSGHCGPGGCGPSSSTNINNPKRGNSGGNGGRPTLLGAEHIKLGGLVGQIGAWIGVDTSSSGGGGGAPGTARRHDTSGARGSDGLDGSFGVGGGGGGGGGGAAFVKGQSCVFEIFGCKRSSDVFGDGGDGGNGGKGGFGAGGGAGGTAGENAMGKGRRQPGGAGGAGGSVHGDNSGSRGANSDNSDGEKVAGGGSVSGAGDALGAALAILNPNSKVALNNVDFVNNKAISKTGSVDNIYMISGSPGGTLSGNSLYMYDDYNGVNRREIQLNKTLNDNSNYAKIADSSELNPEAPKNIHRAVSLERNDKLARIRDQTINHNPGTADITTIQVERPSSTLRPINIDSSALEASINDLYKRVIPVEDEATIKNRFKERIISGFISAASGGYASYSNAGSFFKASENKYNADTKSSAIKMGAAAAGVGFLKSIWDAHKSYKSEIEQNKKNLEELNQLQKVDRGVTADPIDIGQDRSLITIKNFTIGEDTIYLDDFWSSNLEDYSPIILNGMGRENDKKVETFEIHLKTSSNAPTKVAEVQLNTESVKKLNSALQRDAVGYITALLKPNPERKQWEISTTLTDPSRIVQSSPSYTAGPAGEVVTIERENLANLSRPWSTTTFNYNDIIYGSDGTDQINTNGGNDFIKPGYGKDTINGGESIDWVSFAGLKEPIKAIGTSKKNDLGKFVNTINVNNEGNTNRNNILDSVLENIEAISSFGSSTFNLKNAPSPNLLQLANTEDSLPGFYSIRSGSGSTIQGSAFDDQVIISLMDDENSTDFEATRNNFNSSNNLKILEKPSIIESNGGEDNLSFAFSGTAPELKIIDLSEGEFSGYNGIIKGDTVIAFSKGFDVSRIKAIHESETDKPSSPKISHKEGINLIFTNDEIEAEENSTDDLANIEASNSFDSSALDEFQTLPDPSVQSIQGPVRKEGNKSNEKLKGSLFNDELKGRDGNDQLIGKAGDDILIGGNGKNIIKPGRGNDLIYLHPRGIQIIKGFNASKDTLVMPEQFTEKSLEFSKQFIFHKNDMIAKIV